MSRTGTRTLLHYVLHKFNRVNPLSLVNKSFHVTYISIEDTRVTWLTKDGMLTYTYESNWKVQISEHNNGFAYNLNRATYVVMVPHMEIGFFADDRRIIGVYYNNIPRIRALKDPFLITIWNELNNRDISGKLQVLSSWKDYLKSCILVDWQIESLYK
jgi:hypothetical protein